MSRSYKKPWIKDRCKGERNRAARKVRHSTDVPDGKTYRKFFNSWNISDWSFCVRHPDARCSWNSFLHSLYLKNLDWLEEEKAKDRLNYTKRCGNRRALRRRLKKRIE